MFGIILFTLSNYFLSNSKNYNSIVLITNLIIVLFSVYGMYFGDKYNYSLNKIFYLFVFFFFGISPSIEFVLGVRYWRGSFVSEVQYIWMNVIIILILLIYAYFYKLFYKFRDSFVEKKIVGIFSKKLKSRKKVNFILLIISLSAALIVLYINKFSLYSLLLRGGEGVERIQTEKMVHLLLSKFIRPLPVVCLIIFKIKNIQSKTFEIILLLILLLTNFPTSSARFYVAAIYIPVLLLYIPIFRKKLILNQSLILGIIFLFPLLDEMRKFSGLENLKLGFKFQMFLEGHFDSYQNFLRIVVNDITTNGKQLLTTILFFVPRKLWSGKSIGSGTYLQKEVGLSYDNIAMNYFGEGYINFGYIGIILFTIFLAFINSRFDKIYWLKLKKTNVLRGIYLLSLGMQFFILRGDLLSSFAFTVGILFSLCFAYRCVLK